MPIDPSIALRVKPLQVESPVNQMMKFQAMQSAEKQNVLADLKLKTYERDVLEQNQLRTYIKGADLSDPVVRRGLNRFGKAGSDLATSLSNQETASFTRRKLESDFIVQRLKASRQTLDGVNNPEDYMRWHQGNHADPILGPWLKSRGVTPESARQRIDEAVKGGPEAFAKLLQESKVGAENVLKNETAMARLTTQERGQDVRLETAGMRDERQKEANQLRQAKLDFDADPDLQETLSAAKAKGKAMAENKVEAKRDLPKVIQEAKKSLNIIDQMIGNEDEGISQHPGFQDVVGATWRPGLRFVPGTDAANFQTLFDQMTGAAFLTAFETLKGGGQITENEGNKATVAIERMRLSQSEVAFIKAALEFKQIIAQGVGRAEKHAGVGETTAPPVADALSPEDAAALKWANDNPDDPRATEIKERLGK